MMRRIDLNADLGEGYGPSAAGEDEAMLSVVTSANVACGGHAGDTESMFRTLSVAAERGVVVGAHPGYPDREGFGRRLIPMTNEQITRMVAAQIGALQAIAALVPVRVAYVKAHGALANLAARDAGVATAVARAVRQVDPDLALLAISGTQVEQVARRMGVPVFREIFADRGYLASGHLVPRGQDGDLIHHPHTAAERILQFIDSGLMPVVDGDPIPLHADSICVHGDSPGAVQMARMIRERLAAAGVGLSSFGSGPE